MELDKLAEDDAKISIRGGIKKDQLRHEEEFSGTIYKYDLPVGNVPIMFKRDTSLTVELEEKTPVISIMSSLECDKDASFEAFIIKHN